MAVESQYQNHRSFWLGEGEQAIFVSLHLPHWQEEGSNPKNLGVVICNPIGYEYTHSHRSLRHLANNLAAHGLPTLRFDWHGTGDSSADMLTPQRLLDWQANIALSVDYLKMHLGVRKIALAGLRIGATLAALYASQSKDVDFLLCWSAVFNGKRYVREMQAMQKVSEGAQLATEGYIDSGGFILSDETAAELKKLNLNELQYPVGLSVLLLERDDFSLDETFKRALEQQNIRVQQEEFTGYLDMMAEPQFTTVPHQCLSDITDWLLKQPGVLVEKPALDYCIQENTVLRFQPSHNGLKQTDEIQEKILEIKNAKKPLFGILSAPAKKKADKVIVLANSGSVHHVGPNRLYVELARALALAGIACLRFDLETLGDSVCGTPDDENSDYPAMDMQNMQVAVKAMRKQGFAYIVTSGLCSGAHAAFHSALLMSEEVDHTILINPLTFDAKERARRMAAGQALSYKTESDIKYYLNALKDPKKWLKLLKGGASISYIAGFIIKFLVKKAKLIWERSKAALGFSNLPKLAQEILKLEENQQIITLFIASLDPGEKILEAEAGVNIVRQQKSKGVLKLISIEGANHTFSYKPHRDNFVQSYVAYMEKI